MTSYLNPTALVTAARGEKVEAAAEAKRKSVGADLMAALSAKRVAS